MVNRMDTYNGYVWWIERIHTMDMYSPLIKQLKLKKYHYYSDTELIRNIVLDHLRYRACL